MNKEVILIGGTAGVGKTTLAREICYNLFIDHRLGTGFIREIIRSQTDQKSNPHLFNYTFGTEDPIKNYKEQCNSLYSSITACIKRARLEGTSLVIEGNHLLPSLYKNQADKFIILDIQDFNDHRNRIVGKSHTNREISDYDFSKVRKIQKYIIADANKSGIPIIQYKNNIEQIIDMMKNE